MSLNYAWEKLHVAVLGMTRNTGSLQERLRGAYLNFHTLGLDIDADFPPDLRDSYREIEEELTKVPAKGDEGTVAATTHAMSDDEAWKLIEQIVSLYDEVAQRLGVADQEWLRTTNHESAHPVQKYDIGTWTLVHNVESNQAIMRLNGVVMLPVGAVIELPSSNAIARVVEVRLLAPNPMSSDPSDKAAFICLAVQVEEP